MAFNYGFPATYQPLYPNTQPYTQLAPVQQQNTNVQPSVQGSLNWIQGEQAAKSYLVAPNSTVVLFDSESQSIYIKSADASGMPSMKILDYTIRDLNKNPSNTASGITEEALSSYATKDEMKAVSEEITALREKVESLTRRRRKEEEE